MDGELTPPPTLTPPCPLTGFSVGLNSVLGLLAKGSARWAVFCVYLPFPSQGAQSHLFTEALNGRLCRWDSLDFPGTPCSVRLHFTPEFGSLLGEAILLEP